MSYLEEKFLPDIKKSILYVENTSDYHSHIDALLYNVAYITTVHTRDEAIELLSGSIFDLFVVDLINDNDITHNVARELKKDYPETPIIVLLSPNSISPAVEANASFIKNGLDETVFASTVKNLLF